MVHKAQVFTTLPYSCLNIYGHIKNVLGPVLYFTSYVVQNSYTNKYPSNKCIHLINLYN